jgi:outer membrane protein insertion porin family
MISSSQYYRGRSSFYGRQRGWAAVCKCNETSRSTHPIKHRDGSRTLPPQQAKSGFAGDAEFVYREPKESGLARSALMALIAAMTCVLAMCALARAQGNRPPESKPDADPDARSMVPARPEIGSLIAVTGRRVHDIQLRGVPSTLETQRLLSLIPQKTNQPLDKHKLRSSIQALYATGRFQEIEVTAEPAPQNEISLVFIGKRNQFVGPVAVTGSPRHGPTNHQLVNASKLQLGELLTEDRLKQGIASMHRVLEEDGFYQTTITPQLTPHMDTQQVDILFRVESGPRARVGEIQVTGDPGFTAEQISDIAKLHSGDPVTGQGVTRGLERLRKKYQKQDRLEAQASVVSRAYRSDSNTVDYTLNIVRGPLVAIHVEGARLSDSVIKRSVPVYEEGAVDNDLLNEGRRNLRDYLQTQGYFDSQVAVVRKDQPGEDRTDIVFDLNRGERHKLIAVVLEGNNYFRDDLIRDRMQIQPSGWLLPHGFFSQALPNRDLESVRELYRANGFLQANAYAEVQDDYLGKHGHIRVVVHIAEGPQTLVKDLSIAGATTFASSELQNLLANVPGQPFSEANMASDHDALVNFYFNRGFPEVTVTYAAQPLVGEPNRMAVSYTIHEGERVYVNQVLLSGLYYTRRFVVDRQIVTHPGDPLSQADLFRSQSRLYDLGIFSAVDVAVQNPEGEEAYKDVLFNLTEARRYTFDYGLGFEVQTGSAASTGTPQGRTGASPRVSFDVNRLNFRGRNDTIFFKSHFGRLQQRALLGYEVPNWLDHESVKLTFNTLYDNTRDVFTFTSQRLEGSVQVQQTWSKATTLLYRLTYRDVRVANLSIDPNQIPLLSRPVRVGIPSFTYIRDTRNDPVDSHKGNYLVFDTGVASHVLGSQANFGRFLVQHSEYHPFGYKGRFVLAHSTRLGIEQPWGADAIIPLPERFFAGGGNSLRGFAINQAGPRDRVTGFQLGGEAMFVNNVELRLPPVPLPFIGKDLSPVLFHDMGNVFASASQVFPSLFRWSRRTECDASTCNFDYTSHALGGGIRYRTPIGPVRFDVGYNLNPPAFPIGNQSSPTIQMLHKVNFFFSVGQTF